MRGGETAGLFRDPSMRTTHAPQTTDEILLEVSLVVRRRVKVTRLDKATIVIPRVADTTARTTTKSKSTSSVEATTAVRKTVTMTTVQKTFADGNQRRGSIVDENRVGRDRSSVNRDSGYRYNEPADVDDRDKRDPRASRNVRMYDDDDNRGNPTRSSRPSREYVEISTSNRPRPQEDDREDLGGQSRKRKSPPQRGNPSRKQLSAPRETGQLQYYTRSPSGERDYNPRDTRNPRDDRGPYRHQTTSPVSFYVRDAQGNQLIDYEEYGRYQDRERRAGREPVTIGGRPRLAIPTPIRQSDETRQSLMLSQGRSSPMNLSFAGDSAPNTNELNSSTSTTASQRQTQLLGMQSTIALQQLQILDTNERGFIGSAAALEFYENSSRYTHNYRVTDVISIKAQRSIEDQILVDMDYPFDKDTKVGWQDKLSVQQVAGLVHRYFRAPVSHGKSLNEKFYAVHFAYCHNNKEIQMQVFTKMRECVETHVQSYGELIQADHNALILILEKKLPLNMEVTSMYKAAKAADGTTGKEKYTECIRRFFAQVEFIRKQFQQNAIHGDGDAVFCNPRHT